MPTSSSPRAGQGPGRKNKHSTSSSKGPPTTGQQQPQLAGATRSSNLHVGTSAQEDSSPPMSPVQRTPTAALTQLRTEPAAGFTTGSGTGNNSSSTRGSPLKGHQHPPRGAAGPPATAAGAANLSPGATTTSTSGSGSCRGPSYPSSFASAVAGSRDSGSASPRTPTTPAAAAATQLITPAAAAAAAAAAAVVSTSGGPPVDSRFRAVLNPFFVPHSTAALTSSINTNPAFEGDADECVSGTSSQVASPRCHLVSPGVVTGTSRKVAATAAAGQAPAIAAAAAAGVQQQPPAAAAAGTGALAAAVGAGAAQQPATAATPSAAGWQQAAAPMAAMQTVPGATTAAAATATTSAAAQGLQDRGPAGLAHLQLDDSSSSGGSRRRGRSKSRSKSRGRSSARSPRSPVHPYYAGNKPSAAAGGEGPTAAGPQVATAAAGGAAARAGAAAGGGEAAAGAAAAAEGSVSRQAAGAAAGGGAGAAGSVGRQAAGTPLPGAMEAAAAAATGAAQGGTAAVGEGAGATGAATGLGDHAAGAASPAAAGGVGKQAEGETLPAGAAAAVPVARRTAGAAAGTDSTQGSQGQMAGTSLSGPSAAHQSLVPGTAPASSSSSSSSGSGNTSGSSSGSRRSSGSAVCSSPELLTRLLPSHPANTEPRGVPGVNSSAELLTRLLPGHAAADSDLTRQLEKLLEDILPGHLGDSELTQQLGKLPAGVLPLVAAWYSLYCCGSVWAGDIGGLARGHYNGFPAFEDNFVKVCGAPNIIAQFRALRLVCPKIRVRLLRVALAGDHLVQILNQQTYFLPWWMRMGLLAWLLPEALTLWAATSLTLAPAAHLPVAVAVAPAAGGLAGGGGSCSSGAHAVPNQQQQQQPPQQGLVIARHQEVFLNLPTLPLLVRWVVGMWLSLSWRLLEAGCGLAWAKAEPWVCALRCFLKM